MAQRLATEYVNTCLQLSEAEMLKFIQLFSEHQIVLQAKVYENGNQEVVFHDEAGEEIILSFERKFGKYVCEGRCRLSSPRLANFMRKVVSSFRGDAVVHRIYAHYTMVYYYAKGTVVKIVEIRNEQEKIIYEFKDTLGQLKKLFYKQQVEEQIEGIHQQINDLLDQRNSTCDPVMHCHIDEHLQKLTHELFVLEA